MLFALIDWTTVMLGALAIVNTIASGVLAVWMRKVDRRAARADQAAADARADRDRARDRVSSVPPGPDGPCVHHCD